MKNLKEYIKNYIKENLENLENTSCYICDLSSTLYESDNASGSITCNRAESLDFITEHQTEYRNVIKYWNFHDGADFSNEVALAFFDNPEKAHCLLVFCYVDSVLNIYLSRREDWNEEKEITREFIDEIIDNLDSMIDEGFADLDSYGNE